MKSRLGAVWGGGMAVALACLAPAGLAAQGVTGSAVTGAISSEAGPPIEGASVRLRNATTGESYTATTRSNGRYFINNVTPGGPFTISIAAIGYQATTKADFRLALGQRLDLSFILKPQVIELQELTVESQLANPLINNGRTGPSTTVGDTAISRLPLQGRNVTDLIQTSPQVTGTSVNGQNNRYNNIQIDGGANNDLFGLAASGTPGGQASAKPISIEAVQEFSVQVAPFDVRQGNFAGGLVNAITKSGGNEFTGSVFAYYQNKALAGYQSDPTFTGYNIWQYGGSLGGPIIRDKLQFFVSADIQAKESAFGNQYQISGTDPVADSSRAGFTNETANEFIQILQDTYGVTGIGNALAPQLPNPDRNVFGKLSWQIKENSSLALSYNYVSASLGQLTRNPTSTTIPGRLRDGYQMSESGWTQANTTNTGRLQWNVLFGNNTSNELLAGFSIIRDERPTADLPNYPQILVATGKLGTASSFISAGADRFSQQNFLNQNIYQIQDNVTFALGGNHLLTVGTSNEFFNFKNTFFQASIGVWAFNSLDSLEQGIPAAFQRRFAGSDVQEPGTAAFSVSQIGFYVEDSWTPTRNLTLTPGLRIDIPFLSEANANPKLLDLPTFPGGGINTSEVPSGNVLWSPRLGFNYDFKGDASTVLRGGVGIFSGRPPYVWVSNAYSINGLSQIQLTCASAATGIPAFTVDPNNQPDACPNQAPGPPVNQGEIDYFDPSTKYPQNLRVALGIDHRLPWGLVGTFDFLYTKDVNQFYVTDANLVDKGANGEGRQVYGAFTPSTTRFTAVPERYDPVNLTQAVKMYNKSEGRAYSFTFQLQKNFTTKFALNAGYTYTNVQDLMSLTSSQALSNFQFAPVDGTLENRNLRTSAFSTPNNIIVSGTVNLPWTAFVSLIYNGRSGTPYTWGVNGDVNADGINGNDLVFVPADPTQILLKDPTQWDALNSFIDSQPCLAEARGGFLQRSACRNPWQNYLNMRLGFTIPTFRNQGLDIEWDIFNVPNLINSDWFLFKQVTSFEVPDPKFLAAVGYDDVTKQPIYNFTQPSVIEQTVYSPTQSRWRMQLGARYHF